MPDLADTVADGYVEADEHAEDLGEAFANRIRDLLENPEQRPPGLWRDAGAPVEAKLSEVMTAATQNFAALSLAGAIYAAAETQAFMEILGRQVIESAVNGAQKIMRQAKSTGASELSAQIRAGTSRAKFQEAKERRKNGQGNDAA